MLPPGEPHVFVSHSKKDPNLSALAKAFKSAGMKMDAMEFENMTPPPYQDIRERISDEWARATFVLLSEYVSDKEALHTRNWVAFKIGLSCMRGLPVLVLAPEKGDLKFVVPYCTAHMLYSPTEPIQEKFLSLILKSLKPVMVAQVVGNMATNLDLFPGAKLVCTKCLMQFVQVNGRITSPCPSCGANAENKPLIEAIKAFQLVQSNPISGSEKP